MKLRMIGLGICLMVGGPLLAQTTASPPASPPASPIITPPPAAPKYGVVRVVITTSMGPITVELEKQRAPLTTANFLRYVDQKRFDGVTFYRRSRAPGTTDKGFIQGGTLDPKRLLPPVAHEPTSKTGLSHVDGALSMPRFKPGTARGDFTILLGDAPSMDAQPGGPGDNLGYAVFGHVIAGMDVVRRIHAAPTSPTKGSGIMRGELLSPEIRIITARRAK
jgi:peptidyl-prolyl cis-trans isomerase A (cyclophilin A)